MPTPEDTFALLSEEIRHWDKGLWLLTRAVPEEDRLLVALWCAWLCQCERSVTTAEHEPMVRLIQWQWWRDLLAYVASSPSLEMERYATPLYTGLVHTPTMVPLIETLLTQFDPLIDSELPISSLEAWLDVWAVSPGTPTLSLFFLLRMIRSLHPYTTSPYQRLRVEDQVLATLLEQRALPLLPLDASPLTRALDQYVRGMLPAAYTSVRTPTKQPPRHYARLAWQLLCWILRR